MSATDGFNIRHWLAELGLEQYASAFEENHITSITLAELTDEDLKELGVTSLGHRKLLLAEIRQISLVPGRRRPPKNVLIEQTSPSEPESELVKLQASVMEAQHALDEAPESEPKKPVVMRPPPNALRASVEVSSASSANPEPERADSSPVAQVSADVEKTPSVRAEKSASRKTIWTRITASKILLGSIVAHLLFGVGATYFIVQHYTAKRKTTFQGGPPAGPNPSKRALEHKVSMAQKKKTGGAPPQAKRIATAGIASISLPDMPTLSNASTVVPGMKSGMGGMGFGMGMGIGSGMGSGMGGGMGGGGSGSSLFGFRGGNTGLVGTFYDLKQTRDRKPTDMAGSPNEGVVIHSAEANRYIETLKQFVRSWNPAVLSKFYSPQTQLATTQIFIPIISAAEAPKAFGVEKECQGRRWIIHYKGEIIAPRTGKFRFVGIGDDILVVRCNQRNVLDGCLGFYRLDPGANESENPLPTGKWIEMHAGEVLKLAVIIGECPGGNFCNFLMIEEQGAEHPPGAFPVFQLRQMAIPENAHVAHHGSIIFSSRPNLRDSLFNMSRQ